MTDAQRQIHESRLPGVKTAYNPWVTELFGDKAVTFSSLPDGASFHFPKSKDIGVKVRGNRYKQNGHTFTTGAGTAVIPVETQKTAGYSYSSAPMSVLFVDAKKPVRPTGQ